MAFDFGHKYPSIVIVKALILVSGNTLTCCCFPRVHVNMKINFVNIIINLLMLTWENQTDLVRTAMMLHGF